MAVLKPLLAAKISSSSSSSEKASSSLPLQFLLVSETGVEREFLIVADAPELGVRVLGVAELESGGLLHFGFFFQITVDGKQKNENVKCRLSLSLSLSSLARARVRVSCVFPLEGSANSSERKTHTRHAPRAQRDPVQLSGGCRCSGRAKEEMEKKAEKSERFLRRRLAGGKKKTHPSTPTSFLFFYRRALSPRSLSLSLSLVTLGPKQKLNTLQKTKKSDAPPSLPPSQPAALDADPRRSGSTGLGPPLHRLEPPLDLGRLAPLAPAGPPVPSAASERGFTT